MSATDHSLVRRTIELKSLIIVKCLALPGHQFCRKLCENVFGKRTTKELFDECLHKYVITDAIRDENVLKFSVEYIGKYKKKQSSLNFVDIDVEGIDTKELLDSEDRLDKISNYILQYHAAKTHNKHFTGLFCVSSIDTLIRYYDLFKAKATT